MEAANDDHPITTGADVLAGWIIHDHPTTAGLQFTPNGIATCFRPFY